MASDKTELSAGFAAISGKAKSSFSTAIRFLLIFLKWTGLSAAAGIVCGAAGCLFHACIEGATEFRELNGFLIFFLPLGGLVIVFIYGIFKQKNVDGTNFVIDAVRKDGKVPFTMAPAIIIGTVLTHLLGGSAGREGAALQLGGSLGSQLGRLFKADRTDMHVMVFCGMSAVFSALFGTPLTAVIFVMEVISVGTIYYSAILPCVFSSVIAYYVRVLLGINAFHYDISGAFPEMSWQPLLQSVGLGIACALLSILVCVALSKTRKLAKTALKNDYVRVFVGGCIIVLLTLLFGTDYNGAGMRVVDSAILAGTVKPEAFLLKLVFTAITLAVGFRGGEIVPTFFIGSTFGCFFAPLMGMNPQLGAALGLIAVFCGATNTPVASIILGVELFGAEGLPLYAIVCAISYMLSGYYSLYKTQIIVYDKLKAVYLNRRAQ